MLLRLRAELWYPPRGEPARRDLPHLHSGPASRPARSPLSLRPRGPGGGPRPGLPALSSPGAGTAARDREEKLAEDSPEALPEAPTEGDAERR